MEKKKCLITGAAGFLGNAFLREAARTYPDDIFRAFIHRRNFSGGTSKIEIFHGSLESDGEARAAVQGVSLVVHFAGITHALQEESYEKINAEGTRRLVEASKRAGVGHFIYVSTRAIGTACGAYGASKERAEIYLKESGVPFTILRVAEAYGPGSSEGVNAAISLVRRFPVVAYLKDARLSPVWFEDVISAVLAAYQRPPSQMTYVIAGPEEYEFREFLERVAKALGKRRVLVPIPRSLLEGAARLFRILGLFRTAPDQFQRLFCRKDADIKAARRDLGFAPRTLDEGIRNLMKPRVS